MALTYYDLIAAKLRLEEMCPLCESGLHPEVVYSIQVMVDDKDHRNFPVSKNRSKRIEKKLIKRYGGIYKKKPAILRVGDRLMAHPIFRGSIERAR